MKDSLVPSLPPPLPLEIHELPPKDVHSKETKKNTENGAHGKVEDSEKNGSDKPDEQIDSKEAKKNTAKGGHEKIVPKNGSDKLDEQIDSKETKKNTAKGAHEKAVDGEKNGSDKPDEDEKNDCDKSDEQINEPAGKSNDDDKSNEADEEPPKKKRRIGRPPGSRPLKRANLKRKVEDPGKDMANLRSSAEFIRYLKKSKLHDLGAEYTKLKEAREERDSAAKYVREKKEEVEKIKAMLEAAQGELEEGEVRLMKEEETFQSALDSVTEMELKRPGSWNEHYQKLVAYKEAHGNINLPTRCRDNKELDQLCLWVTRQKAQYKRYQYGEVKNERPWRITALEKLGIEWEVKSGLWDKSYKELIAYKARHGNCMVPTRTSNEYKDLGLWVTVQREEGRKHSEGKKSTINQERVDLLNEIGFVWNVTNFQWQQMYEKLLTFSSEEGHANVPAIYPYDQPLSNWVARQRKEYQDFCDENVDHERDSLGRLRSMRMTEERIELLNNIGFEWSEE